MTSGAPERGLIDSMQPGTHLHGAPVVRTLYSSNADGTSISWVEDFSLDLERLSFQHRESKEIGQKAELD